MDELDKVPVPLGAQQAWPMPGSQREVWKHW